MKRSNILKEYFPKFKIFKLFDRGLYNFSSKKSSPKNVELLLKIKGNETDSCSFTGVKKRVPFIIKRFSLNLYLQQVTA